MILMPSVLPEFFGLCDIAVFEYREDIEDILQAICVDFLIESKNFVKRVKV